MIITPSRAHTVQDINTLPRGPNETGEQWYASSRLAYRLVCWGHSFPNCSGSSLKIIVTCSMNSSSDLQCTRSFQWFSFGLGEHLLERSRCWEQQLLWSSAQRWQKTGAENSRGPQGRCAVAAWAQRSFGSRPATACLDSSPVGCNTLGSHPDQEPLCLLSTWPHSPWLHTPLWILWPVPAADPV